MARYLLVDDRDGRVLAELASVQQAMQLLGRFPGNSPGSPTVRLVRLDHQQGSLIETTSTVSMRPLPPLMPRRATTIKRSPERPSRHPPATPPGLTL